MENQLAGEKKHFLNPLTNKLPVFELKIYKLTNENAALCTYLEANQARGFNKSIKPSQ